MAHTLQRTSACCVVFHILTALVPLLIACSTDDPLIAGGRHQPTLKDAGHDAGRDATTVGAGGMNNPPVMSGSDAGNGPPVVIPNVICGRVDSVALHARKAIVSQDVAPNSGDTVVTITKEDLYSDFANSCGTAPCHGGKDEPLEVSPTPFKMTLESFDDRPNLGSQALERILSEDEDVTMPPGTGIGAERTENDPYRILGEQLKLWEDEGFPEELEIVIQAPAEEGNLGDPYLLGEELGDSLTNIGSCVPIANIERKVDEMQVIDDMFANAESFDDLPETLAETDLISLDSELLARRGVYSYAPTYTLFSDNAEKMRYLRVPVGETITYNEETKDFDIPENTRFYKTFLKKVIDKNGEEGYRKMETRLIVSRDNEQLPDGTFRPRALKVVYAWDNDELMARKVTDPLRNGEPWADRLCPYVTDESEPRDPIVNPTIERVSPTCTYMTDEELEDESSGKIRHYAIPSTERCDQCHMGSNSRSFILGFSPFHADRRAAGEGGTFEDPHEGEIDQLARLIAYGVISGIDPGQAKLEESQGDRTPRNEHELKAQGYMMGNCAFCHNPRGFPTVQNPVLAPFDMYPSETGGIFQFPLEKYSSRAKFGVDQKVRYPYITPAFGNHEGGQSQTAVSRKQFSTGERSPVTDLNPGVNVAGFPIWVVTGAPDVEYSRFKVDTFGTPYPPLFTFLGPWRSLIWRNVYTPFTYSEDNGIFIHMPRNVPGFDCRAQKIMADWMLSIPSKDCRHLDSTQPAPVCEGKEALKKPGETAYNLDQPYEELLPDSPDYSKAVRDAEDRVEAYRTSVTGQHCPTDDDIVDAQVILSPKVLGTERKEYTAPQDPEIVVPPNGPRVVNDPEAWAGMRDGVPNRAHWVPVDTTDNLAQGWIPRRSNWEAVIAERTVSVDQQLNTVIDELQGLHLSGDQKEFSERSLPMGLWHPDCWQTDEAIASPTIAELQVNALTRQASDLRDLELWTLETDQDDAPLPLLAPVHSQGRGEAVFRAICQNCHGRSADSRSPLASTIGELTGGETRVANFVDGIFGPRAAPGLFAEDEFRINDGATPAEWQVRYMLFMGLGGTESVIPEIALSLVSTSPFYGTAVRAGQASGANMLQAASGKCDAVLHTLWQVDNGLTVHPKPGRFTFLKGTAEFELWESICGYQNTPVVRVLQAGNEQGVRFSSNLAILYRAQDDSGAWVYPTDHPVGNRLGKSQLGIQSDNYLPWCVRPDANTTHEALIQIFEQEGLHESLMPICPDSLFATAFGGKEIYRLEGDAATSFDNSAFLQRVSRRGAMNAGIAAYHYLDGITKGTLAPSSAFDACRENP